MGQVLPALDPKTPVYAAGYTMQLLSRRMQEFGMWDPDRFHVFNMRQRFDLGPFEYAPSPLFTRASFCDAFGRPHRWRDITLLACKLPPGVCATVWWT